MIEEVAHYRILDRLGAGALGELFRARDTRLGRTVALRLVHLGIVQDADRRERLLADARATALLSHPSIATLFEIGGDRGRLFLAWEYVSGESLRQVVGNQPLNPRRAIDLALQIGDALAEGHAHGIVHGDLRPDNILITTTGRAKVLEFGFAAWTTGGAVQRAVTGQDELSPAAVLSVVAYLAPEQTLGEGADRRADVYSLGVILYEMLTGESPFARTSGSHATVQLLHAALRPASVANPSVPRELDPVVARATAKSLEGRYAQIGDFTIALRQVVERLETRPVPSSGGARTASAVSPPLTRHFPALATVLTVTFLVLLAIALFVLLR